MSCTPVLWVRLSRAASTASRPWGCRWTTTRPRPTSKRPSSTDAALDAAATLPRPLCLNVNVPAIPLGEIRGIKPCRQTKGFWREDFYRRQDPHGRDYFWLTGKFNNAEPDAEDSDEWALAHGYVAVVPVQVDMTDYRMLSALPDILP